MGMVAALLHTDAITDVGASRSMIAHILGGIAAVEAVIGVVLIVKS